MSHDDAQILTTCEREPIHTPGMIQAHGVLLALSEPDLVIRDVSRNIVSIFGRPAEHAGHVARHVARRWAVQAATEVQPSGGMERFAAHDFADCLGSAG